MEDVEKEKKTKLKERAAVTARIKTRRKDKTKTKTKTKTNKPMKNQKNTTREARKLLRRRPEKEMTARRRRWLVPCLVSPPWSETETSLWLMRKLTKWSLQSSVLVLSSSKSLKSTAEARPGLLRLPRPSLT